MFSKLHDRLGTAGLIVAVVALVAALTGTAVAAGGLSGKQKKEVEKIAKTYAGKPGPAGAKGDSGATGSKGDKGENGTPGIAGTPGANGKSVVVGNAPSAECPEGGVSVAVEGSGGEEFVCNGAEGQQGSPWTAGGNLPSHSTETGTWIGHGHENETVAAPINFFLPLATAPTPTFVEGTTATGCPGVVNGVPTAEPGHLCLYKGLKSGAVIEEEEEDGTMVKVIGFAKPTAPGIEPGSAKSGSIFEFGCAASQCTWLGTWAVTAS